jgi:hypothetical protein
MKIKHLREWLTILPQELDEYNLVFRKIISENTKNWLVRDKTITTCGIDEGNNEAYFCDESSREVMKNSVVEVFSPIIEGRTKSNVKNNTQTKRLAPPPPPMKRGVIY